MKCAYLCVVLDEDAIISNVHSVEFVSASKAAKMLGDVHPSQVRSWAIKGKIRSRKLPSGHWQVLLRDIERIKQGEWSEVVSLEKARDKLTAATAKLESAQSNYNQALAAFHEAERAVDRTHMERGVKASKTHSTEKVVTP